MEDLEKDIPNVKKKIKNVLKSVFKAKKLLIVIIIILVLIFISAMDSKELDVVSINGDKTGVNSP